MMPAFGTTTFTNAFDTDANNAANWSGGLPAGAENDAVIDTGAIATTSANFNTANEGFNMTVNGTLNVSTDHTLDLGDGFASPANGNLIVNSGGIVNLSGRVLILGGGADTQLKEGGTINLLSGGQLDERKFLIMSGGTLSFELGSLGLNSTGFSLTGTATSTLSFDIVGGGFTGAVFDTPANLDSAGGMNLFADIIGATAGDSYTILMANSVAGTFDAFNYNIDSGLEANVSYTGTTAVINITAVPEPSSAALLGLSGIALILRRRK